VAVIEAVVAYKGYHSRTTVHDLETLETRIHFSEPDRGPQSWIDLEAERDAVYANRLRGDSGQRLLRKPSEQQERPCAHVYETGGFRHGHVCGHQNVLKRLLVHASAFSWGSGCGRFSGSVRSAVAKAVWPRFVLSKLWSLVCNTITPMGSQTDPPTPSVPTDEQVNCVTLKTPLAPRAARLGVESSDSNRMKRTGSKK